MIFDDIASLDAIILLTRSRGKTFTDSHDPEVNRLFNSSPPLSQAATFEAESIFRSGDTKSALTTNPGESKDNVRKEGPPALGGNLQLQSRLQASSPGPMFAVVPIPPRPISASTLTSMTTNDSSHSSNGAPLSPASGSENVVVSMLTQLLEAKPTSGAGGSTASGKRIKLTIYLPDLSPFEIHIPEMENFEGVILSVLKKHQEDGRQPALYYHCPEMYELRMHEGDGEPDRDFPALDRTKTLKHFNLNEYCLCETDDDFLNIESETFDAALMATAKDRGGSSSGRGKMSTGLDERDSDFDVPVMNSQSISDDMVVISIPNAENLKLPIDEDTTLRSLLPHIAESLLRRGHKLRLHGDELSFMIAPEEQTRLKTMSAVVGLDTKIKSFGARRLELQKRVFADSVKSSRLPGAATRQFAARAEGDNVVYTDTLAVVYQEWNVVKKNKFGRKQERIIGIDGKMVYNSRRDKFKGHASNSVYRAQRDISTIRKVEAVNGDDKTLRITWEEGDSALYDIEYTCETTKDCADIVAKLSYLISKKR